MNVDMMIVEAGKKFSSGEGKRYVFQEQDMVEFVKSVTLDIIHDMSYQKQLFGVEGDNE